LLAARLLFPQKIGWLSHLGREQRSEEPVIGSLVINVVLGNWRAFKQREYQKSFKNGRNKQYRNESNDVCMFQRPEQHRTKDEN
jgi:hypothetical protein